MKDKYMTVDEYFATLDEETKEKLNLIRQKIKEILPNAKEKISWGMPTYFYKENLVHYFAHKNHIGFYPGDKAIEVFKTEFKELGYKFSKGAVQFPKNKPMPLELIERITKFRLNEVE